MTLRAADRYYFTGMCDYLVQLVGDACIREWAPYAGNLTDLAVWQAKTAMRRARQLGLYPTTEQLEQESRRAA